MDDVLILDKEDIFDPWPSVDERLDLELAIKQLTEKQREALAYWLEGYTQREIGAMLGVSQVAVHYRIGGALGRIREFLT